MIAVIVPTLNEEEAVESVIEGFPEEYRDHDLEIYVVDGGSTDSTVEKARDAGAEIIHQTRKGGKGNGLSQALEEIDADIYVTIDGDGTYDPDEIGRVLDPILEGEAEHVIGRRSRREKGSIPRLNLVGNRVFNLIARFTTGKNIHDMLSGYRAFTRESLEHTYFTSPGFGIETEMTFTAIENHVPVKEVEISYYNRKGESELNPVKDGWRIVKTIVWSVRDMNPLKFFSSIALLFTLMASYPAYLAIKEKLTTGFIQNPGTAITAGVLVILAVQFLMTGMIADQLKTTERRLKKRV